MRDGVVGFFQIAWLNPVLIAFNGSLTKQTGDGRSN